MGNVLLLYLCLYHLLTEELCHLSFFDLIIRTLMILLLMKHLNLVVHELLVQNYYLPQLPLIVLAHLTLVIIVLHEHSSNFQYCKKHAQGYGLPTCLALLTRL